MCTLFYYTRPVFSLERIMNRSEYISDEQLPELVVPPRVGWKVNRSEIEQGPVFSAGREDNSESFYLSNRTFEAIDKYLSYKLLALILKKIKENPNRPITILDVGGGVLSECVRGILRHPHLKGRVKCINIDLFAQPMEKAQLAAEGIDPEALTVLNADFLEQEIPPNSADIAISYQVLDNFDPSKIQAFLAKVAATLAPNGEAYLNENWYLTRSAIMGGWAFFPMPFAPSPGFNQHWLQQIANEHNVYIASAFGETRLDGTTHIMGSGTGLVYMGKTDLNGRTPNPSDFTLAFPEIHEAIKSYR